jgi:hypothetical protein
MILQIWDIFQGFFDWVAESAAIMLILAGVIAITWLGYEMKRRRSFTKRKVDEYEFNVTKFLRILSYLGIIVGIFCIWSGAVGLLRNLPPSFKYEELYGPNAGANHFTSISLIVLGIVMFLKPINDLPWAGIIGLIVGGVVTFLIAIAVPDQLVQVIAVFIDPRWVLGILFLLITAIVALSVKFYITGLMAISKVLSWPPIAVIIMIYCFLQGFSLWIFGFSLIPNIL